MNCHVIPRAIRAATGGEPLQCFLLVNLALIVIAAVCLAIVATAWRAHLPTGEGDAAADASDETRTTAATGANGALEASRMG